MSRTFEHQKAVRSKVPLLVGLMGPSGGGKTFSALRMATGIQRVTGGKIFVIDTESCRARHYADDFDFQHVDFQPPFGSLDYLNAINYCVDQGAGVTIIDSASHEHEGPGGYLETAEHELDRMAGDNWGKRQACKLASFIKPSSERRKMIAGILRLNTNLIFCFRAKDKVRPMKDKGGKTEIATMGFMPIAGNDLVFEMAACALLMPRAGGVPTWNPENMGEKMMTKLPEYFRDVFADNRPIDEEIGERMAEWARGDAPSEQPTDQQSTSQPTTDSETVDRQALLDIGESKARESKAALEAWGASLTAPSKRAIGKKQWDEWMEVARE